VVAVFQVEQQALAVLAAGVMVVELQMLQMERIIRAVVVEVVGIRLQALSMVFLAQAAQALSFSSGLSPYRSQTPLHLQEHG
jgi:hypothetical protein